MGVIHIVSGPSCVGKTTFLERAEGHHAAGWSAGTPVLFPNDAVLARCVEGDCVYHYNILRPIHFIAFSTPGSRLRHVAAAYGPRRWRRIRRGWSYDRDPRWLSIAQADVLKSAIVLVAAREAILERAARRIDVEPSRPGAPYPRGDWLAILQKVDLTWLYRAWCTELTRRAISWQMIDATAPDYPVVSPESLEPILRGIPIHR